MDSGGEASYIYLLLRVSTCSAQERGDAHFVLWNACNTCNSCYSGPPVPRFEGLNLFSERKLKNNREIYFVINSNTNSFRCLFLA